MTSERHAGQRVPLVHRGRIAPHVHPTMLTYPFKLNYPDAAPVVGKPRTRMGTSGRPYPCVFAIEFQVEELLQKWQTPQRHATEK